MRQYRFPFSQNGLDEMRGPSAIPIHASAIGHRNQDPGAFGSSKELDEAMLLDLVARFPAEGVSLEEGDGAACSPGVPR